ncbi:MAG TPA: XdhC family protein [Thermoanaerobaculia bacterium]|nr:XdhC family protein [Thermoanaerobaculia bacterium]
MSLGRLLEAVHASPSNYIGMATVIAVEGSAYRHAGARMLVADGDQHVGTISGGCLEADVVEHIRALQPGSFKRLSYDTRSDDDLVWGTGSGCNGVISIVVERWSSDTVPPHLLLLATKADRAPIVLATSISGRGHALVEQDGDALPRIETSANDQWFFDLARPAESVTIFGSGEDARSVAKFAAALDWKVTLVDTRQVSGLPDSVKTIAAPFETWAKTPRAAHVVVMTHHFEKDLHALRSAFSSNATYIGLLGASGRTERLLAALGETIDATRLHSPIGLDIGAETPAEIALAIVAEMTAAARNRGAGFLRNRISPLHDIEHSARR